MTTDAHERAPGALARGEFTMEHAPPRDPEWIWPGWLARGMLHIFDGDAGTGKSAIANWLVSLASRPRATWPGDKDRAGKTGILTLLYSQESPYKYTTANDLQANKANLSNILLGKAESWWHLLGNAEFLCDSMIADPKQKNIDLIVIDTWSHYAAMADIDDIKTAQVTSALSQLAQLCHRHQVAAIVLVHTRKYVRSGSGRGASAFRAVPRVAWSVETDHTDPKKVRILARTKENLGIGLDGGFAIEMKADTSLTYRAIEGYGPTLIKDAMMSSE